MNSRYDIVVVGAGPAGMVAATQAAQLGLSTLLVDEQSRPGGQIYRAAEASPLADRRILGPEYRRGAALAAEFRACGAEYRPATAVWEITPDRWVGLTTDDAVSFVGAERIVLATGALERPFPIPGWTLPGVMTAGAAQILLKAAALAPGPGTVVAGSGPLVYLLVAQLLRAGHPVQALLDTAAPGSYARALPLLPAALRHWRPLAKGLGMLAAIRRAGIQHIRGVAALRAEGDGRVESVVFRHRGMEKRLASDLLLLHQGVVPNIQLTQALRCEHRWDAEQLCWRPKLDAWGRTSMEGVSVAGDGAGISGALAAEHQGRLAALDAACSLGRIDAATRDRLAAPARAELVREHLVRPFLDRLYRPAEAFRIPSADDTLVCRCEEVTAGEIRRAVAHGCQGPNQLKAFLRAGMGPCQGRLCGLTVCETIAKARGVSPEDIGYYRLRSPTKPVTLGALAAMAPPDRHEERPRATVPD